MNIKQVMMHAKNQSQLWDKLWNDPHYRKGDLWGIQKELRGIRWRRMENIILKKFGDIRGLKVVELGAGAGKVSAITAQYGADVTLIDFSESAVKRASSLFEQLQLPATFQCLDIFSIPLDFKDQFDISMSFGLAEHFTEKKRIDVIQKHMEMIKPGGVAFIAVPNRWNLPYRIYKILTQHLGTWRYGEEHPFSRKELRDICNSLQIGNYSFFGDSLVSSLGYMHPFGSIRKALGRKPPKQRGTCLDQYLAYSLVLCAEKSPKN